jgi:hypothetical protein
MSGASVDQVVDSFASFLLAHAGEGHFKKFVQRLRANPESAKAEAVMFTWAYVSGLNPEISETLSGGGIDFVCRPTTGSAFELEVTVIGTEASAAKSELPTDPLHPGGWYGLITGTMRGRVKDKRRQLAASMSGLPLVLAIVCLHPMAELILNRTAAVALLISDPFVSYPIYEDGMGEGVEATDLRRSAFLAPDKNDPRKIVPINREASAILLAPVGHDWVRPVGIVHPDPLIPFDIFSLPLVPLLQLDTWPVEDGRIETRWTWESDPPYPALRRLK